LKVEEGRGMPGAWTRRFRGLFHALVETKKQRILHFVLDDSSGVWRDLRRG
jgi:hypothetical protein